MRSLRRLPILLGVVLMMASAALAQTGTITITGQTPEAFSMTDTSGAALSTTIGFGVLTPANSATLANGAATVRMRSNKAYKVSAQAVLSIPTPGADDGGDPMSLLDFGFGVTGLTLTGANVANTGTRTDTVAAGYSVPLGAWPAATNGLTPAFGKTLNDITASTQILNGTRISKKGNLQTDNNFIEATFGVAILPQFFTPNTGFTATITLTMASQ